VFNNTNFFFIYFIPASFAGGDKINKYFVKKQLTPVFEEKTKNRKCENAMI